MPTSNMNNINIDNTAIPPPPHPNPSGFPQHLTHPSDNQNNNNHSNNTTTTTTTTANNNSTNDSNNNSITAGLQNLKISSNDKKPFRSAKSDPQIRQPLADDKIQQRILEFKMKRDNEARESPTSPPLSHSNLHLDNNNNNNNNNVNINNDCHSNSNNNIDNSRSPSFAADHPGSPNGMPFPNSIPATGSIPSQFSHIYQSQQHQQHQQHSQQIHQNTYSHSRSLPNTSNVSRTPIVTSPTIPGVTGPPLGPGPSGSRSISAINSNNGSNSGSDLRPSYPGSKTLPPINYYPSKPIRPIAPTTQQQRVPSSRVPHQFQPSNALLNPSGSVGGGGFNSAHGLPSKRPNFPQSFSSPPSTSAAKAMPGKNKKFNPKLEFVNGGGNPFSAPPINDLSVNGSPVLDTDTSNGFSGFNSVKDYIDIKNGSLMFEGKASVHSNGVDFSSGTSFKISTNDLKVIEQLGSGNYGTVSKALHKPTGVTLAMKEVRLALEESKFRQILMELDVLHKCDSPFIVDFFGAFFVEGAVYMCIEYMDGGSLDQIYGDGLDERMLAYIAECVVRGLKELKDSHNIIHRDVKPTNILVNSAGKVKLCDFGVSGNLVASQAKTNIGCQSYMPPERISSKAHESTYNVKSDVWSLGISLVEVAIGKFPYKSDSGIFAQLSTIVSGDPPNFPDNFSPQARSFIKKCLNKNPVQRPTYSELLEHPWLVENRKHMKEMKLEFADFVKKKIKENSLIKDQELAKQYQKLNESIEKDSKMKLQRQKSLKKNALLS